MIRITKAAKHTTLGGPNMMYHVPCGITLNGGPNMMHHVWHNPEWWTKHDAPCVA